METAIPEPQDVVLLIDLTQSMTRTYGAGQRTFLNVAQEVTSTIVDTLNNGDRVSNDQTTLLRHACLVTDYGL